MSGINPFIRWAGGKTWLIPYLANLIKPIQINHYHEPFLGSGAIFLSLENKRKSYLSDANTDLINAYQQVKDCPELVIKKLNEFINTKEQYYNIRNTEFHDPLDRAAQFIYLNQTSYNGLYRVNKAGQYNVPYGNRTNLHYDNQRILQVSKKLQNTRIDCGDFEINKRRIRPGDLIFLDPPYTVSHNNNGFIEYNRKLFSLDDQYRLHNYIGYIKQKGAYYILTNAAHPTIKEIFGQDDRILELERPSLIGGKNSTRGIIKEYVFTNISEDIRNE